ncbi:MAG: nickel-dependent hydrogenase large subunit [Brucellaceae bacterium]|nr:nickel-dependent hydrogenase large subunit [Brucellaceae bacterium]
MSGGPILLVADLAGNTAPGLDGFVRLAVTSEQWSGLTRACAEAHQDLSALWVDGPDVRMALIARDRSVRAIATLRMTDGGYPSVSQFHAPAIRLERAMRDLHGVIPQGLPDERGWLDHGRWPHSAEASKQPYAFLPVEGEGTHQIPVGPVHAGIIEPGHFRFAANGELVVRLEERLGYVHKGIEALAGDKPVDEAARLIARVSGDSTVACSLAFARAVEAAIGIEVPERAVLLRAVMAELERIAHHVNDFGAICNDASVVAVHAHCTLLRETILQACGETFGHRLMMDRIVPGGVSIDPEAAALDGLRSLLDHVETEFRQAVRVYDSSPSILDRTVSTGRVSKALVERFAAGGHVGRASGRDFDSRRDAAYAPYDRLDFSVPLREDGDVNARAWIRIDEVTQSIALLRQMLERLQPGPVQADVTFGKAGEGAALAEAFRGDVFVAVRLEKDGTVARCHVRDASCFQWPLLEAAIEGNIVADFPLCNKSFNCSYSGHDM